MEIKQNNNKRLTPNQVALIGTTIMILGVFLLSYNYVQTKKIVAYDYMSSLFLKKELVKNVYVEEENDVVEEEIEEVVTNDYIGYLSIPSINFNKGFLSKKALDNDVEKNIYVLPESSYPDRKNGNLIIAGHSGTGWKAFFKDLYKLTEGDLAYVDYKGVSYTYKIVSIYTQPKTGTVGIYRNPDVNTLTLITCTNNDSTTQTIYIAELISSTQN